MRKLTKIAIVWFVYFVSDKKGGYVLYSLLILLHVHANSSKRKIEKKIFALKNRKEIENVQRFVRRGRRAAA